MADAEIWKDIEGYEGLYQVSSLGKIKNKQGLIMKTFKKYKDKDYQQLVLCKDGVKSTKTLHIIVAKAFPEICGEYFKGAEVDHIDGNPANNSAFNLRHVSHTDNLHNPNTRPNMFGHQQRKRAVEQLTIDGEYIKTWAMVKEAADFYGFSPSNIHAVACGKYKSSHGFKWRYAS